jgi:hypothetical protein
MADTKEAKVSPRLIGFIVVVMFLFGGTVGYIVRDARADVQVLRAANDARESAQQLATEAFRRTQVAAGTVALGVRAAAESTGVAIDQLTGDADATADVPDTAGAPAVPTPPAAASTSGRKSSGTAKSTKR